MKAIPNKEIFEDFANTFGLTYCGEAEPNHPGIGCFQDNLVDGAFFTTVSVWLAKRILEIYEENSDGG